MTVPFLAVTSVGVYLTVPDTEHAIQVMPVMLMAAIVCFVASVRLPAILGSLASIVIVGAALADSAGLGAPIARATGCFGVLLAAPVAGWLNQLRTEEGSERRPTMTTLVIVHGIVVGWSSRALIRQESVGLVVIAVGVALVAAVAVLFATARPVAVEP
jgi:hypothetical protein